MKKKQIIGLIVAAAVFIAVGASSVFVNAAVKDTFSDGKGLLKSLSGYTMPIEDYIGVVKIEGTIGDFPNYDASGIVAGSPVDFIETYKNDENNKGIMLYIDSGGGSVYETDEIYLALMDYKQQTERPVWAWCGSMVASGAYYIASAADEIVTNRNCWIGSIGVYIQNLNVAGLMDKLGIDNEYIKTGDSKAMGSMYEPLTEEQRAIYQGLVDDAYEHFLGVVIAARGYEREELLPIADGRVYTVTQSIENGLIDGAKDFSPYCDEKLEMCGADTVYVPVDPAYSWFSSFLASVKSALPHSDTQSAIDYIENNESGVLMYKYGG